MTFLQLLALDADYFYPFILNYLYSPYSTIGKKKKTFGLYVWFGLFYFILFYDLASS
jgi:hypothetical protein